MAEAQPLVSVDVVPFRYSPSEGLLFATGARLFEPFIGVQALPGVLLNAGESIREAASRALSVKVGLEPGEFFHVGAFDSTNRDPRGATISIALASIHHRSCDSSKAHWASVHDTLNSESLRSALPFDHSSILARARERLSHELWNDIIVTRALLGESFTTADALAVKAPTPHRSNVTRWLKSWGPLEPIGSALSQGAGAGRPAKKWSWK